MLEKLTFAPLHSDSLRGNIVQLLTEAILLGKIKPGQRLNETQLSRQFRVSRAPVREALNQLQEQGLVENSPRRGMFVTKLDEEDVAKINRLRVILEGEALRMCRENLTAQGERQLTQLVERMEKMQPEPVVHVIRLDLDFHRTIWRLAGNEYLEKMLIGITTPLLAQAIMMKRKPDRMRSVLVSHRPLLEFVQGKSTESAEEAVLTHIEHWWATHPEWKNVATGTPMQPRL